MSDIYKCPCGCGKVYTAKELLPEDDGNSELAAATGSVELARKLQMDGLTSDDLMPVEALAYRAAKAGCKEVEDACVTVICVLQGNYGIPPNSDYTNQRLA